MKKITLLFLTLVGLSCSRKEATVKVETRTIENNNLELELIDAIPEKFDGCAETLSYDTIKGIAIRYLFLSNIRDMAMIRINGKNIYLLKDTIKSKQINSKNYIEYFKNSEIEAIVKLKLIEQYDEGGFYNGTLFIKGKGINKIYKVKGESGC